LRRPGTQRDIEVAGPLEGLTVATTTVPIDADITARLTLESILDGGLTATGSVRAPWTGECRRCLRAVDGEVVAEVREVFRRRLAGEPELDSDTYPLDEDQVDLEPLVRDAVLLALPVAPLCDQACAGPDPEVHPVLTEVDDDEREPDPRWGPLGELKFD
jgi:uncharacterized protein